ncbi:hypothetical protein BD626DRAFT_494931 [Schizophyllum amplum]|uniref:Uncharacterized protein n=1 Tax=Schizophyllum amplum TaxID=97359 RepID=A0A550CG33_9AGAR|nr:hypothetical protein BD626DRAFT_494931 [Auriculariopsis ampla]
MKFSPVRVLAALALAAVASACEGECIVGITEAWISNMSLPMHMVFRETAQNLSSLVYDEPDPHHGFEYLSPVMHDYTNASYDGMLTAIFPSYFHGKCQRNGVEPPGCPNPDCPVVCGTPGSLVHFYSTLREIAVNQTQTLVMQTVQKNADDVVEHVVRDANTEDARQPAKEALARMGSRLRHHCGEDLQDCSWEQEMKEYILSFP